MAWGQPDPQAIVRQSVANCERDWNAGATWAWTQTDISDTDGKKEITVSEVLPVGGTPYERVIRKDGRPLSPDEQRRENRKYLKIVNLRENEPPAEREARIRKYENERAFLRDIPNAYKFTLLGEENIEGRPAWVIGMTPRPDFVSTAPHSSMLQRFQGKLWIDKEDLQWAKAEARAVDTVTIGWIVARVGPGARFTYEQTRIADGLWMPKHFHVSGVVRLMMLCTRDLNEDVTYSDYHLERQLRADIR